MSSRKAPAQQEIDEEYLRSLMAAPEPAASSSDTEVSEQAETLLQNFAGDLPYTLENTQ